MSADYPDHDWRTEQYGTIRGKFYAVVNFAWCEPTGAPSWRWYVGRVEDCEMVADGYNYATAAEARAAADKWVAEYADGNPFDFSWLPTTKNEERVGTP